VPAGLDYRPTPRPYRADPTAPRPIRIPPPPEGGGFLRRYLVKDILAHVTTWEEEALQHLPLIIAGGTPPRYAAQGGIDAFNARATEAGRRRSLAEVLRRRDETHARLLDFIRRQPAGTFGGRTRARRRLRLDTYGHYPEHTAAIQTWREAHQAWSS
jgi:hypothetical protein